MFVRHAKTFEWRRIEQSCAYRRNQHITAGLDIPISVLLVTGHHFLKLYIPSACHTGFEIGKIKTKHICYGGINYSKVKIKKLSRHAHTRSQLAHNRAARTQSASMALSRPRAATHKRDKFSSPSAIKTSAAASKCRLFLNYSK